MHAIRHRARAPLVPALLLGVVAVLLGSVAPTRAFADPLPGRWSESRARTWDLNTGWKVGCNYGPATAINQLEMWQADTFDPATLDRELGWAQDLGFNSLRVFLHDQAWSQDPKGFLKRVDTFLDLAEKHRIGVILVPFDAVWDPFPKAGPQRAPKPHVHNSGWVQSPGAEILGDPSRHDSMKPYLDAVMHRFRNDRRVHAWDLFNEPDNPNTSAYGSVELRDKKERALEFLTKVWGWARAIEARQPLTSGVWIGNWADPEKLTPMEKFQLENSDIISFHHYGDLAGLQKCVENLRRYRRPILCTEYMARPVGSTFDPHLGWMRERNVAAYNWGFVAGKTQTQYPWDSWKQTYTAEPPVWFHEIFRADGRAYRPEEVRYIRRITRADQR